MARTERCQFCIATPIGPGQSAHRTGGQPRDRDEAARVLGNLSGLDPSCLWPVSAWVTVRFPELASQEMHPTIRPGDLSDDAPDSNYFSALSPPSSSPVARNLNSASVNWACDTSQRARCANSGGTRISQWRASPSSEVSLRPSTPSSKWMTWLRLTMRSARIETRTNCQDRRRATTSVVAPDRPAAGTRKL